MTRRHHLLSAAAGALFSICGATSVVADNFNPSSEAFEKLKISAAEDQLAAGLYTQNAITVVPDESDWAFAKPTQLSLPFHLEAKVSKIKWRIKNSVITISVAPIQSGGLLYDFHPANYAAHIDHGDTKHYDKDSWWTAEVTANNSLGARARNACRDLRKQLAQQGMSHDEIFSQDRHIILPTEFRYSARVAHKNDYYDIVQANTWGTYWMQTQPTYRNIDVICQKGGASMVVGGAKPDPTPIPAGSANLAVMFQVKQAALAVTPKPYIGKCPAKLHLTPTIEALGKGTVKYRFVDQLGHHSQTFQVKFDKSDIKFLDHVIEIDGKGKPKGLGFAVAPAQGGQIGLAAPTNPNLTQGYFQLEILSPHKKLSNTASYSVKCTVQQVGNAFVGNPDVVKPVIMGELAVGLADLVIDEIQPSPAVPTKLFVKVSNKGKAPSTPTNLKAIRWVGDQSSARGTLVPAIQPGQSQVVLAELGGTIDGATLLYLRVDDPNRIKELDESNNAFKVK